MTDADRYKNEFEAGEFVRVEGRGSLYNGQVQLVLSTIRRVNPDQDRQQGFREEDAILSAPRPIDEMWAELQGHLRGVKNDHIRVLLNRIVADNEAQLRVWPAAQQIHHAYRGGFLEHITKMAEVGRLIARAYGADEDLVLAGVVLHDIGKLQELAYEGGAGSYTRDGNLVGHIAPRHDDGPRSRATASPDSRSSCARRSNTWSPRTTAFANTDRRSSRRRSKRSSSPRSTSSMRS